jgi:hypothetical protein
MNLPARPRLHIERLELDLRGLDPATAQAAVRALGPALAQALAGASPPAESRARLDAGSLAAPAAPASGPLATSMARRIARSLKENAS